MISRTTFLGALVAGAVLTVAAQAQINRSRIYSRPEVPSADVLRRLNLVVAWKGYVPLDGGRDQIILTDIDGGDLFVITRSGLVARYDAETGTPRWRTRVAKPYTIAPFLAANARSVYVIANVELYSLDRATGTQKWDYRIRRGVSAAPVVDTQQIYIPGSNGILAAFYLPFVGVGDTRSGGADTARSLVYGSRDELRVIRPTPVWEDQTNIQLAFRPLQTADTLLVISPGGKALGFSKFLREGSATTDLYEFSTEGKIRVPPGQYGDIGYLGSDDAAVYAVNLSTGKLRWRHTAGTPITRKPIALDRDVFVTSEKEGMARLDRESGDAMWRVPQGRRLAEFNPDVDRFLAANDRFVYANDYSGRLVILDRRRGVRLSMLDTSAFHVPIVNEVTDRLYLAANDGLIVCLRDRDVRTPIQHRRALQERLTLAVKVLEQPVTAPPGKPSTLREVLAQLRLKYKLKFVPAERAFKEAGMGDFQERQVSTPAANKRPLKDYLQRILSQVNATYQVVDDTILLVPGKPRE
jgi:outer membrane protein assembly factor BamB